MKAKERTLHLLKDEDCGNCDIFENLLHTFQSQLPQSIKQYSCMCKIADGSYGAMLEPPKESVCNSWTKSLWKIR
jgi:hypothetical protein